MRIVGGRLRGLKLAEVGDGDPAAHLRPADVVTTWERLGADPAHLRGTGLTAPGRHDATVLRRLRTDAAELAARLDDALG